MIRELGPIVLIPAAWVLAVLTVVYPEVDTYWIEHMHYFMVLFLAGFTLTSWEKMDTAVLKTWRWIIAVGVFATAAGAVSFHVDSFDQVLASLSLLYWLVAPGVAAYYTKGQMDEYEEEYKIVGYAGVIALSVYLIGITIDGNLLKVLGIGTALVSQTYSIIVAARLDGNI